MSQHEKTREKKVAREHAENTEERRLSTKDELTDFLLYTAPDGQVKIECILHEETIWLTQKQIAALFGVGVPAISKHLKNIFESGELREKVVVSILETTTQHGAIEDKTQVQKTRFYNLDAIISVGYRVNSSRATQFRIWATQLLKEYITKGFAMDDERLKNGRYFGKDYFSELLERVITTFFDYPRATQGAFFRVRWFLFRARQDDAERCFLQRGATPLWMKRGRTMNRQRQVARGYSGWRLW